MKVTFKHEAENNKNESITDTFDIGPGEFALMIATDRQQRAAATGVPLDQVKPRTAQKILDELWNAEEAATHQAVRGDRSKGKKKCTCGAGCGPRRGCRLPNNAPFSYEQMLEIDLDPASPGMSAASPVPSVLGVSAERSSSSPSSASPTSSTSTSSELPASCERRSFSSTSHAARKNHVVGLDDPFDLVEREVPRRCTDPKDHRHRFSDQADQTQRR